MSNIHGLSSFNRRNNEDDGDDDVDDENNRYVGGVDSRGGGSGLAVQPNPSNDGVEGMFRLASFEPSAPSPGSSTPSTVGSSNRHMITMYRSGFTVDNGPYRRLDDPANAEFLRSLSTGRTPREFGSSRETQVGLVDKRSQEYETREQQQPTGFTGAGETLGSTTTVEDGNVSHIIDPSEIPPNDEEISNDQTSIQVRLLSGKRFILKISKSASIRQLALKINASGNAGDSSYILVAGYPPKPITNLCATIEEAGLSNSSVTQKKA